MLKKTLGALALSTAVVATQGAADGHAIDLSGKTVEWIIPFSETGGSAKWANFYAPLLSEALPGNPTVVVTFNPGAGSTKGANAFQEMSYEDGTTIFGSSGSTQFPYLLSDPRVRYEYSDWNVVLASGTGGVAYLPTEMAGNLGDGGDATPLAGEDFIYGSQGATRLDLVPLLAWEMLGLAVEPVFGIEGRGDGRLMFERGEANIDYQTSSSYLSGVTPLVEAGAQKMVFLPAGAPQEAIDTYTAAFEAVKARADFAEISAKRLGVYPQMTGAAAQTALASGTDVPAEAKDFVINWLSERYGVVLQ